MSAVADAAVAAIMDGSALELPEYEPWALYARLRAESPRHFSEKWGMTVLTEYEDVLLALRHPGTDLGVEIRRKAREESNVVWRRLATSMLYFEDPADTKRHRGMLRPSFTGAAVAKLRESTREIIRDRIGSCLDKGTFDVMADFADHIPVAVICKMLGVPLEDAELFRSWTRTAAKLTGAAVSPEDLAEGIENTTRLREYMDQLLADLRRGGVPAEDGLLGRLVEAQRSDPRLTDEEVVHLAMFLLGAGSDTTTQLITSSILTLLRHPAAWRDLRNDPARVPQGLEELIRFSGPVHYAQPRWMKEPLELPSGIHLNAGDVVLPVVAAANHDPKRFAHPDTLDLSREHVVHLGFSQGLHLCMGAMLARMEAAVALQEFLQAFGDVEVIGDVQWVSLGPMRGTSELIVSATPAQ